MKYGYYDVIQGKFIRVRAKNSKGKIGPMGCLHNEGYIYIGVIGYKFFQSHLVYLWFTGKLPITGEQLDHISGNRTDDRPQNLRLVSNMLNCRNQRKRCDNTSGERGVYWDRYKGKWLARGYENSKIVHLGYFPTFELAVVARKAWITDNPKLGYTVRHGS